MSNKGIAALLFTIMLAVIGIICFVKTVIGIICVVKTLHVNDVQNLQVIQSIDGDITVRREGGWYAMICTRIWEYPKASVEICKEADRDAISMQFSNKSTATLNCQIGYRIDSTNDEQIIKLHQMMNIGTSADGKNSIGALDQLIQTMTIEKLGTISPAQIKK